MEALVPLLAVLGVLGLLAFAILKIIVKVSSWEELAEVFPSHGSLPTGIAYGGCAGRLGKVSFGGQGRGLTVTILDQGLGVHIALPMMPDLLIPWDRVTSVQELSMFGRRTLSIVVDGPVDVRVDVPTEASTHLKARLAADVFKEPRKLESLDDIVQLHQERKQR
jgi:hypothetical protein